MPTLPTLNLLLTRRFYSKYLSWSSASDYQGSVQIYPLTTLWHDHIACIDDTACPGRETAFYKWACAEPWTSLVCWYHSSFTIFESNNSSKKLSNKSETANICRKKVSSTILKRGTKVVVTLSSISPPQHSLMPWPLTTSSEEALVS